MAGELRRTHAAVPLHEARRLAEEMNRDWGRGRGPMLGSSSPAPDVAAPRSPGARVAVVIPGDPVQRAVMSRALDYYSGRGPIRLFFERQGQISSPDFVIR